MRVANGNGNGYIGDGSGLVLRFCPCGILAIAPQWILIFGVSCLFVACGRAGDPVTPISVVTPRESPTVVVAGLENSQDEQALWIQNPAVDAAASGEHSELRTSFAALSPSQQAKLARRVARALLPTRDELLGVSEEDFLRFLQRRVSGEDVSLLEGIRNAETDISREESLDGLEREYWDLFFDLRDKRKRSHMYPLSARSGRELTTTSTRGDIIQFPDQLSGASAKPTRVACPISFQSSCLNRAEVMASLAYSYTYAQCILDPRSWGLYFSGRGGCDEVAWRAYADDFSWYYDTCMFGCPP